MNRLPRQNAKSLPAQIWESIARSGVLAGCIATCLVIAAGRTWVQVSTATLSGWTSLCLLAVFLGLLVTNLRSRSPFVSKLQALGLLLGSLSSFAALILLEYTQDLASNTLLSFSVILLVPCLLGLRIRPTGARLTQEKALVRWALWLDDLMKYRLSPTARTSVAHLIDLLWQSPPDQPDFISSENDRFEQLLEVLEQVVRTGTTLEIEATVTALTECLQARNAFLTKRVNIEYQHIDPKSLLGSNTELPRRITSR